MNKNIKKLAQSKADKFGGEDSPDQRRRLKAKPYRRERISQTEGPERGTKQLRLYGSADSPTQSLSEYNPATYNSDNKGISATMGRDVARSMRDSRAQGYSDKEAGRMAISGINRDRDTIIKGSEKDNEKAYGRAFDAYERYNRVSDRARQSRDKRMMKSFARGGVSRGAPIGRDQEWWGK
jgi:hypothetical protein